MDLPVVTGKGAASGKATVTPPDTGACCEACAVTSASGVSEHRTAPVLEPIALRVARAPGGPPRRETDRLITLGAVVLAGGFMTLAVAVTVVGAVGGRLGLDWLPLHLVLAGAGGTAIAGVLPFFAAALAAGPPADPRIRIAAVALVAVGASCVATRSLGAPAWLPPFGGLAFLVGFGLVSLMSGRIIRQGLARRRPLVALAYSVALADVLVGAGLATLALSGVEPVAGAWPILRSAHAWLNVIGFVSLVVVGTQLHLLPTVAGTRIVERHSARVAVGGLVAGPPIVAAGLIVTRLGPEPWIAESIVRLGAAFAIIGAIALVMQAVSVGRARGRWTTDLAWHAMSTWSLVAAAVWLAIGIGVAGTRVLVVGAQPTAWASPIVAAPLIVGGLVQALIGAWSHLVPAIGPGGPAGHAVRREILGRASMARVAALNVGTALLAVALPLGPAAGQGTAVAGAVGGILVAAALAADLGLAVLALGARPDRDRRDAARPLPRPIE